MIGRSYSYYSSCVTVTAAAALASNLASRAAGTCENEYTVILRKRLANRLVGRDIAIKTGGGCQHHVVESFVGSEYAFQVRI